MSHWLISVPILVLSAGIYAEPVRTPEPHLMSAGDVTLAPSAIVSSHPAPKWTVPAALELASDFQADTLLFDTQIRVNNKGYELFRRHARRITADNVIANDVGIHLSVVPGKETLALHDVTVWRAGVPHSVRDKITMSVDRSTTGDVAINPYIISGRVADIQPGDVLDWSATWTVSTPDWPSHFYHEFYTEWAVPSLFDRTRIIVPDDKKLSVHRRGNAAQPHVTENEKNTEYVWNRHRTDPVTPIAHLPADTFLYSSVSVSTAETWQDVSSWGTQAYPSSTKFTDAITSTLKQLSGYSIEHQVNWAIRFVQDDIPYDYQRDGLSTHIPRTPYQTLIEGRGDCKDKALLLASLLNAMGIDAVVALTDIDESAALPQRAPSPFAFDHAVVKIMWEGNAIYVDPTQQNQGGFFPTTTRANITYALPLEAGAGLENVPQTQPIARATRVDETIDFRQTPYRLNVVTTYSGADADQFRKSLTNNTRNDLSFASYTYQKERFPGAIIAKPFRYDDYRDQNTVIVSESFSLPDRRAFDVEAGTLFLDLPAFAHAIPGRDVALDLGRTGELVHTITGIGAAPLNATPETLSFAGDGFAFSRKTQWRPGGFVIENRFSNQRQDLTPQAIHDVSQHLAEFRRGLGDVFTLVPERRDHADASTPALATP